MKWYALAVLLAELYSPGDSPAIDHSYLVAREAFAQNASVIADSETGMLWRPIAKLMSRVQRLRGNTASETADFALIFSHAATGLAMDRDVPREPNFTANGNGEYSEQELDLDYFNETMANPDDIMPGFMDSQDGQQERLGNVLDGNLSGINWDSFLEEMTDSANMDQAI